jgi:hypothetical protein
MLDRHQIRIGIEQLSGHGVSQLMTADIHSGFPGVVLHSFLDSAHRHGIALAATLAHQEEPFDLREGSFPVGFFDRMPAACL